MTEAAWMTALLAGACTIILASLAAYSSKDRADRRFILFLGLLLFHTALLVWPAVFHRQLNTDAPLYAAAVLAMAVSLPAYTAERSGVFWQKNLWKGVGILALLLWGALLVFNSVFDKAQTSVFVFLIRALVSATIIASVIPLMRRGGSIDVERIPPRCLDSGPGRQLCRSTAGLQEF